MDYKFKAWQPFEGYQTIAIEDDFEAIMWGLNHQVDIFTQDDKLVYSPNDDEEYNLERLEKYGVGCVDDPKTGRTWIWIGDRKIDYKEAWEELKSRFENYLFALKQNGTPEPVRIQEVELFLKKMSDFEIGRY